MGLVFLRARDSHRVPPARNRQAAPLDHVGTELFEQDRGRLKASRRRVVGYSCLPEGMEWMAMNKDDANESLLVLIGDLLYKNQLLREAIGSKDEALELIIKHLTSAATSACSCGVVNQLIFVRNTVKERDVELARRRRYCFNEFCNIAKYLIDSAANSIGTR